MLELKNVKKSFKDKQVLKDVSVKVNKGECIALIGPNGAGKTTIIRAILGLMNVDNGNILRDFSTTKDVGIMLQNDYFPDNLKVKEAIELHKSYFKSKISTDYLLKLATLENEKNSLVSSLSGGQKRKLSFAIAVSSNPKLLFLDEPTVGMDIQSTKFFWQNIKEIREKETTIFVTLHHLDELNDYCDRFLFLKDGVIVEDVNKKDLNSQKVVIVHSEADKLQDVQRVFGGNIEDDKLFILDMNKYNELLQLMKKGKYIFEERFKEVKDIYREIYVY